METGSRGRQAGRSAVRKQALAVRLRSPCFTLEGISGPGVRAGRGAPPDQTWGLQTGARGDGRTGVVHLGGGPSQHLLLTLCVRVPQLFSGKDVSGGQGRGEKDTRTVSKNHPKGRICKLFSDREWLVL